MEVKRANFENFLKDLLSQKGKQGEPLEIYNIHAVERKSNWWDDLNDAVDYVFSSSPEDIALQMRLRGNSSGLAYFVVNPTTQRLFFLREETDAPQKYNYLDDLLRRTAKKYGISVVAGINELYDRPSKDIATVCIGHGEEGST